MPAGIIIDTGVIGDAPLRTLQAGAGDLLSNLTAILDWELAEAGGYDRFDAFSAMIAESAARPALDLTELESPQSRELLAKGLLLSGLAMASAGTSRPCSGAEHLISHSLDGYLGPRAALHGEQVAIGCLVSAQAHKSRLAAMLREVFLKIGLPTAPEEVGLDRDDLCKAIVAAPGTRPDRYTILSTIELTPAAARELVEQTFPH
jgi:glycerol-1-phosphate dehydrogenase [NAD(P)+]